MELVYDAEINVKCAGIRLIFRIIDALSVEMRANRILTLFIEMLTSINEEVLKVISSQIGYIVYKVIFLYYNSNCKIFGKLESFIKKNPSYISSILSTFKEYGCNKNEEIRKNFAFNLPAILSILDPKQFDFFKNIYINQLLNEKSFEIRQIAVSCLHEIVKLLPWEDVHKNFKDIIKSLFKESNYVLLRKLIVNLNQILEAFYNDDVWTNEEYVSDLNILFKFQKGE